MPKRTITYHVNVDSTGAVKGFRNAEESLGAIDNRVPKVQKGLLSLDNVGRLVAAGGIGMILQKAIARSIQKGKEFETQLASLEAITGITGPQLQRLGEKSLELSKMYGTSASNIIEANKLVASKLAEKIDFGTEKGFQELQKISEQAVVLSKAAGITLQEAVDTTTNTINQFGFAASDSARIINTLAAGSKYGAAEVGQIGRSLINAGTAAASAGQSIEVTNGAIQTLAQNGLVGEASGTALRSIFLRLQTSAVELAELGIENVDLKTNGLIATLRQLNPIVEDAAAMKTIFGEMAFSAAQILIKEADTVENLTEKVTGTNIAYEQAAVQMDTFEGATDRLQATIDAGLIPAFTESNGVMVALIDNLIWLIEEFSGGLGVINGWVADWGRMNDAIGDTATAMNKIADYIPVLRLWRGVLRATGVIEDTRIYKELFEAIDEGSQAITDQINYLGNSITTWKSQREEVEEGTIFYERLTSAIEKNRLKLADSANQFEGYLDVLKGNRETLEEGTFAYAENEEKIKQSETALAALSEKLKEVNALLADNAGAQGADSGSTGGGEEAQINNLLTLAGLQAELADAKNKFSLAENDQTRAMHATRMQELAAEIELMGNKFNSQSRNLDSIAGLRAEIATQEKGYLEATTDEERQAHLQVIQNLQAQVEAKSATTTAQINDLNSIAGLKAELNVTEQNYLKASSDAERDKHAQAMTELQQMLDAMNIRTNVEASSLESIAGIQEELRQQEIGFKNATTEADRARFAENIEQLELLQQAKIEGLEVEDILRQQMHQRVMANLQEVLQHSLGAVNLLGALSSANDRKRINAINAEKKEMEDLYAKRLANEHLTDAEREKITQARDKRETELEARLALAKKRSAEAEKRWAITRALMEGAINIVKAFPNPMKMAAAAIITGIQVAIIKAQDAPTFADGGLIKGPRHSQGGQLIEAEGGEFINNRESTRKNYPWLKLSNDNPDLFNQLMQSIPSFESGGLYLPSPEDFKIDLPNSNIGDISSQISAAISKAFESNIIRVEGEIGDRVIYLSNQRAAEVYDKDRLGFPKNPKPL